LVWLRVVARVAGPPRSAIFSLSLHDALPILFGAVPAARVCAFPWKAERTRMDDSVVILYNGEPVSVPKEVAEFLEQERKREQAQDRKSTRLNSSHVSISYAVFCLKKKKTTLE